MDKAEAILAVNLNCICRVGNVRYYAYGNERIKELNKPAQEYILLHDLTANSITRAEIEKTVVEDWYAPAAYVDACLKHIRALQNAQK